MSHATPGVTLWGMTRTRISTTVDTEQLQRARGVVGGRDSELFDQALAVLVEQDEVRRDHEALADAPYDEDDELQLGAPEIDWDAELPYDGAVPDEVVELARRRRHSPS